MFVDLTLDEDDDIQFESGNGLSASNPISTGVSPAKVEECGIGFDNGTSGSSGSSGSGGSGNSSGNG
eukprot:Pgem_evm1s16704